MRKFLLILGVLGGTACTSLTSTKPADRSMASAEAPRSCVALRGNGPLITAHWAALARVLEKGQLVTGGAGGSSGSITLFLYESILKNPQLRTCATGPCSDEEVARRAALLLKSLFSYLDVIKNSEEAASLLGFSKTLRASISKMKTLGDAPTAEELASLRAGILKILRDTSVRSLLNKEFIRFVNEPGLSPELRAFRLREAQRSLTHFGDFEGSDSRVFYQPGIFDFGEIARRLGWVGDFYAGRGTHYDAAGMQKFLDQCAGIAVGKTWTEFAHGDGGACVSLAAQLIVAYRNIRSRQPDDVNSRINEWVGSGGHFLVSTSVLDAPEWARLQKNTARYWAGDADYDKQDRAVFGQMKFGYFGNEQDVSEVRDRSAGSDDLKTAKAAGYAHVTWQEALSRSPAEPGLAAIRGGFQNGGATAGGWDDLAPVEQLRNLGCRDVTYITRRGGDSVFGQQIARLFGMTDEQWTRLYDLKNEQSSFSRALKSADRVSCTNWDYFHPQEVEQIERDAYGESSDSRDWLGCGGQKIPEPRPKAY